MAEPEKSFGEFQAEYDKAYGQVRNARAAKDPTAVDAALDNLSVARDNLLLAQPSVDPKPRKSKRW